MKREEIVNLKDPPNSALDQLINAAIMAGLGFFTTLAGIGAAGLLSDWKTGLLAASIATGLEFFVALTIQKGLVKKHE